MKKKIILVGMLCTTFGLAFSSVIGTTAHSWVSATEGQYRHYLGIDPTCEDEGLKEYWTNCKGDTTLVDPEQSPYIEMQLADSEAVLADLLANNPYDERIIEASGHYDLDFDFECDECGEEIEGVEGTIVTPLTYMGRGETLHISSDVTAHGGVSSDVYFEVEMLSTSGDPRFILTDNKDGTASIFCTANTATATHSCNVYLYAKYDDSLLDSFKLDASTYGSDKRSTIKSFFGLSDWQFIPYIYGNTMKVSGNTMTATITTAFAKAVGAFKNQGTWTLVSETANEVVFRIADPNDVGQYFKCVFTKNGTGAIAVFTKEENIMTTFPTAEMEAFVTEMGATGTVPTYDGGISYKPTSDTGYYSPGVIVTVEDPDAAFEAYQKILENAGWFVYKQSGSDLYYGYEGKTLLINPYVYDEKLNIDLSKNYTPVTRPITSWPTDGVSNLIETIGATGTLPALENGTNYEVSMSADYSMPGIIVTFSTTVDAYDATQNYITLLTNDGWSVTGQLFGYYDLYTKTGSTLGVSVYDYYSEVYILLQKVTTVE